MNAQLSLFPEDESAGRSLLPLTKKIIDRQDEQGKAISMMFESITSMYDDFAKKYGEVIEMVGEVRDSVTLNDSEIYELQSAVYRKSKELADSNDDGKEKITKRIGRYRHFIYSGMKKKFKVHRYVRVRRIDFQEALQFVNDFALEGYMV